VVLGQTSVRVCWFFLVIIVRPVFHIRSSVIRKCIVCLLEVAGKRGTVSLQHLSPPHPLKKPMQDTLTIWKVSLQDERLKNRFSISGMKIRLSSSQLYPYYLWTPLILRTWLLEPLSDGVRWSGRQYDYILLSLALERNAWTSTTTPPYTFIVWCLIKHKDFTCSKRLRQSDAGFCCSRPSSRLESKFKLWPSHDTTRHKTKGRAYTARSQVKFNFIHWVTKP
jgi:hypothetical protein